MVLLSGTFGGQLARISVFALKTSTGGESKDRSNQDPDEAERLLERGEVELKGGHPLREGGREIQPGWQGGSCGGGGGGGPIRSAKEEA